MNEAGVRGQGSGVRRTRVLALLTGALLTHLAWGQGANLVKPRMAGAVIASQYQWQAVAHGNGQTGMQTVAVDPGSFTLPDGTAWMPLKVGTPVEVSGDAHPEVVTPTAVDCSVQSGICTLTASFAYAHERMKLTSASDGLQEAVNAAGAGGWVVDDVPVARIAAPLVLQQTVRLTGESAFDASTGTQIIQTTANSDTIQIGTPAATANGVVLEHLLVEGVAGDGSDSGVAVHCVNCVHLRLDGVVAKQAHDGVFFDSAYGHAYVADVTDSHFIDNYYGVHIVGGSANRLTFTGDTVDSNVYGVYDDGGWVHTWVGNDIEANTRYGYWQQISQPGAYSGRNVDLIGNYFENNGSNTAGQGDVYLGQLVDGGSGNNGAGCSQCELNGNIFNASTGGNVTAVNFGAVTAVVSANDYSGYGTGKRYVTITGPDPNFSYVLSLGDGGLGPLNGASPEGFGGAAAGDITRVDPNSALVIGGTDRFTDKFGTMLNDTTIESPSGDIRLRGKPGGAMASNGVQLYLDGNSTTGGGNDIYFANQGTWKWAIANDIAGDNGNTFCPVLNLANPANGVCQQYIGPSGHFQFSGAGQGVPGDVNPFGDYEFLQQANGDSGLVINRFTDTSPSGYLLDIEDKTNSHPLFRVDASGNVQENGTLSVSGTAQFQSAVTGTSASFSGSMSAANYGVVSATTGNFSGAVAAGAGSSVGGKAINTDPAVVDGQSGTWWSGTYAPGSCISGGISFSGGVGIGMAVVSNPETTPPAGLVWNAVIDSANHVAIRVCNISTSSVTWPSGSVWDVRVIP